jgi:uncharacterized YigZ family protein
MARFVLTGPASHESLVKHSRFIAHAAPAASPELALAFRDRISDSAATHNCWAYRIGDLYRFSDDGEPGGSAGRPILAAIDGQGVDRVVVVVTRWYGGVNLGVGGLVRAYGGCASECLRLANKEELTQTTKLHISCSFSQHNRVLAMLAARGATIERERFESDGVEVEALAPSTETERIERALADLSRGAIRVRRERSDG